MRYPGVKLMRHMLLLLVSAALLRAGVEQIPSRKAWGDTEESFAHQTEKLLEGLEAADQGELHEGLPSPGEGKEFLENEKRTKPVVLLDDNWFYLWGSIRVVRRSEAVAALVRRRAVQAMGRGEVLRRGSRGLCGEFQIG